MASRNRVSLISVYSLRHVAVLPAVRAAAKIGNNIRAAKKRTADRSTPTRSTRARQHGRSAAKMSDRAPKSTQEQLRSSAFEQTYYPDPPKREKPATPPTPKSTAEQMRSTSMSLSQAYEKPPSAPAAGRPSSVGQSKAATQASSVFGTPRQHTPPPVPPKSPAPPNPSSKAEMAQSSIFGTPRQHTRPASPEKRVEANPNTRAAMCASSVFGTPRHTRPESPRKAPPAANANSKAAQNASTVFGTPRHATPPPRTPRQQLANANDSVAQNASTVFGTPRHSAPAAGALLSQAGGERGAAKSFAPGEWIMPTPRGRGEGAATTKAAQQVSASLPGTRFTRPESPRKQPPKDTATTTSAQQQSTVFGSPRHTAPPPAVDISDFGPPADAAASRTKGGRNQSSVFPGQTVHTAPPMPAKAPKLPNAASKAEQQRSTVFGVPYGEPEPAAPTGAPAGAPEPTGGVRIAARRPSAVPTETKHETNPLLGGSALGAVPKGASGPIKPEKAPRGPKPPIPVTTADQLVSSVLGGSPNPEHFAATSAERINRSLSYIHVEFDGLPPDAVSHRLHKTLSALPYDAGVTLNRYKVKVEYGGIDGLATGKGSAVFGNIPDGDKVMEALGDAQQRGEFGKNGSVRITTDNRKDINGNSRGKDMRRARTSV